MVFIMRDVHDLHVTLYPTRPVVRGSDYFNIVEVASQTQNVVTNPYGEG